MYFRVSIELLFISKTFQYFYVSIPQAFCYGYSLVDLSALETCFP